MTTTPATTAHPTAPKSARVSAAPRAGRATDQFAKAMRRAERDTQAFKRKHHAQDSGNAFLDAFKKPNVHFVGLNAPYMDPEADVVLRSNDGVDFRVHSDALSGTSEAFKDMLTAPPPSSSGATTSHASITHLRSADSTTPTTQPPAQATTPPHSPAPVQPPIDIEAPALILRHFCDLLTNNTLLPLDHDEREEQSTIYHSRTGSTMVHIPTPRGMLELRRSLQDGHKRRLWRKWQIPKGDVRSPRQGSQGARGMELDGTEGPRGNGQHTLSDDSGPLQPPTTSQHFTDLFRSPSLRGPGAGIARLTALLDLVERFDCSSALLQRALGHYHQSIPRDPWGAFVLFATRGDVERAKVAITHFDKTVKAHREHVRSQGLGPGTRSGRSRKVKGEEAKRTPGQIADGLEAVKREKEGYAFMVDPQNLTVERAAQVPLGCYMGYVRAFDKWRSTQGVVSDEQLRNGSNIDWQYIADNFDPVA